MGDEIEDVDFQEEAAPVEVVDSAKKDSGVPKYFNPLADEVITRDYNDKKDYGAAIDIPEPTINIAPEYEDENLNAEATEEKKGFFDDVTNEKVNQLDGKEKKVAVSSLVGTILDGYEMLHGVAAEKAKINEQKFGQQIMEGVIDPELPLQSQSGEMITPPEMVQSYNKQVEELFEYDKGFNEKVQPAMERVFAKKGWGLTDEQFLMIQFGKDIGTKAMMFAGMKKQSNQMMSMMASMTEQMANIQREQAAPVAPDTITKPAKAEVVDEEITEEEEIYKELGEEEADE